MRDDDDNLGTIMMNIYSAKISRVQMCSQLEWLTSAKSSKVFTFHFQKKS